jgi:hypothetical protein
VRITFDNIRYINQPKALVDGEVSITNTTERNHKTAGVAYRTVSWGESVTAGGRFGGGRSMGLLYDLSKGTHSVTNVGVQNSTSPVVQIYQDTL